MQEALRAAQMAVQHDQVGEFGAAGASVCVCVCARARACVCGVCVCVCVCVSPCVYLSLVRAR